MCDCPPCPLSPHSVQAVFAELQQANLITSEECEGLYKSSRVVFVQSGKSPEVQSKTADVLRRRGFEKESNLLTGKQTLPLIHVPVNCCTVEPCCKGHLKTSIIIVSFPHPVLGHSECVPQPQHFYGTYLCHAPELHGQDLQVLA